MFRPAFYLSIVEKRAASTSVTFEIIALAYAQDSLAHWLSAVWHGSTQIVRQVYLHTDVPSKTWTGSDGIQPGTAMVIHSNVLSPHLGFCSVDAPTCPWPNHNLTFYKPFNLVSKSRFQVITISNRPEILKVSLLCEITENNNTVTAD